MSNDYNDKSWTDRTNWIVTVIALALVAILSIGLLCALFIRPQDEEEAVVPKDGAVLSETKEDGISLMSAKIMPVAYAASGVSALADTAYTLTATVEPDYEGEKTFDWSVKFQSDSSSWASGKTVTDYVTLTPGGEDYAASKSVTLENLQPFGEQIIIKATARDDPEITATCTADYAQKPVDFSLSFGEVSCNFGGDTDVTLEINANAETAPGGAADAQFTKSELYSLSQEFTVTYELTGKKFMSYTASGYGVEGWYIFGTWLPSPDFKDEYADLSGYSVADNGLYFGIKYLSDNLQLHTVGGGMGGLTARPASEHSPSDFIQQFTHAGESLIPEGNSLTYTYGDDLEVLDLQVTLTGEYATYTYETTFVIAGYTNTSTLTGMNVSESGVVF